MAIHSSLKRLLSAQSFILALLLLVAAPTFAGPFSDFGDFGYFGIGLGQYFTKENGTDGWNGRRPAVSIESVLGGRVSERVGVFVLTTIAVNEVEGGVRYSKWAWKEDDWTALRGPFATLLVPFAFLADSQALIGPGVVFYLLPDTPSLYIDAGIGLSSVQSVADDDFMFGGGLFAGLGLDITDKTGFGVRGMWTPAEFSNDWSTSNIDAMTLTGSVRFRLGG